MRPPIARLRHDLATGTDTWGQIANPFKFCTNGRGVGHRWTFLAPIGYVNVPRTYGKSLIPDPERASVVQQIFRDFATGRFTKQELLDEVTRRGLKTRKGLPVSAQAFSTMLQNKLYVGIVEAPGYGVVESVETSIH